MKAYVVKTSNGSFFQIHHVSAPDAREAKRLAEEAANMARFEEALCASMVGEPAPRRYRAFSCERAHAWIPSSRYVRFIDSGAEGA